jgi:PAS domain S-box-containing protein
MNTKDKDTPKEDHKKLLDLHRGITELEKLEAEREQKKNEINEVTRKIHKLFDHEKEGILILQDALVKYTNPYLTGLFGYTPEEVIGKLFVSYLDHKEIPKVTKLYTNRLAGKDVPIIYETKALHKNGNTIRIEISASEIKYQGKPADFVIIKKINK